MTPGDFARLVDRLIAEIPGEFRQRLENLVFVVEQHPDRDILLEAGLTEKDDLLGFYRGYPLQERSHDLVMQEPDMIYLFQQSIEDEAAYCGMPVAQVVRETLVHEMAHYFGFSEAELDRFEALWVARRA